MASKQGAIQTDKLNPNFSTRPFVVVPLKCQLRRQRPNISGSSACLASLPSSPEAVREMHRVAPLNCEYQTNSLSVRLGNRLDDGEDVGPSWCASSLHCGSTPRETWTGRWRVQQVSIFLVFFLFFSCLVFYFFFGSMTVRRFTPSRPLFSPAVNADLLNKIIIKCDSSLRRRDEERSAQRNRRDGSKGCRLHQYPRRQCWHDRSRLGRSQVSAYPRRIRRARLEGLSGRFQCGIWIELYRSLL